MRRENDWISVVVWRHGRIHGGGNCRKHRKRSGQKITECDKPRPVEADRPLLLTGIKENTAAATHNRFVARCVTEDIRRTQSRREIEPSGPPKGRTLRSQRPTIGTGTLNRIGLQSLRHARRGVHFPTQPHREAQTLPHLPIILGKGREVREKRVGGGGDLCECKRVVRLNIALTIYKTVVVRHNGGRLKRVRRKSAIAHAKFELVTPQ